MTRACLAAVLLAALPFSFASAQSAVRIGDAAVAGASGRVALNAGAGSGNAQANLAVLAVGAAAEAAAASRQSAHAAAAGAASAAIDGAAFSGAQGAIAVNQAAGHGNAQLNALALANGAIAEISLEQLDAISAAPNTPPEQQENSTRPRHAVISDSAFSGAGGIVQVNQAAGTGNRTANVFALSIVPPQ